MSVGLDLIEIDRIERALERRPALADRVFTQAEPSSRRRGTACRHLAARFAAKEAALKALGLGGLRLHEVEVRRRRRGAAPAAARQRGGSGGRTRRRAGGLAHALARAGRGGRHRPPRGL